MKAVWTHWTKPLKSYPGLSWLSFGDYLYSFVLSFYLAKKHFGKTCLYTDPEGHFILCEQLNLPFDEVIIELDNLNSNCSFWWTLGKIFTYGKINEPFIHLDNDVFIWEKPDARLLDSDLFAQNPEYFTSESNYYKPIEFETALLANGWLPKEWIFIRNLYGDYQKSINTGIYGGKNNDFIQFCSELVFEIILNPANELILLDLDDKDLIAGMLEMYIPSVCLDYYSIYNSPRFAKPNFTFLFDSAEDAYTNPNKIPYTHLIGKAKKDLVLLEKLKKRVDSEFPQYKGKILSYIEKYGELCEFA